MIKQNNDEYAPKWTTQIELVSSVLKSMDEKQLIQMFHDFDDLLAVDRIAYCANNYLNSSEGGDMDKDDNKQQDDAQRYRDIQSENRRPY